MKPSKLVRYLGPLICRELAGGVRGNRKSSSSRGKACPEHLWPKAREGKEREQEGHVREVLSLGPGV